MGGERRFGDVERPQWERFARAAGLPASRVAPHVAAVARQTLAGLTSTRRVGGRLATVLVKTLAPVRHELPTSTASGEAPPTGDEVAEPDVDGW